jgi:hypothetical protein
MTAYDLSRGTAVCASRADEGFAPCFHLLNVTGDAIVAALTSSMHEQHGGVDDILISNAAACISPERSPATQVAMFVNTDNHSTARMR